MDQRRRTRRTLLGTVGSLCAAFAGCTGRSDDGPSSTDEPSGDDSTATTTDTPTEEPTTTSSPTATTTDTSTPRPTEPRDVTFENVAGGSLTGTLYGRDSCAVVLVPQVNMDRGSWEPQASALSEAGFLAFAIDEGDSKAAGVESAVRYLRTERDVASVVLVGASTGGEAVVVAADAFPDGVAGVVTLSAAGGASHASALNGRTLVVVSEGDDERFVETARALYADAPPPKDRIVYEGSAHGQRLFDSEHGPDLLDRIVSLTTEACG